MGEGREPPQSPIRRRVYTPISLFTIRVDCEIQSGRMTLFSKALGRQEAEQADIGHVLTPPVKLSAATNWAIKTVVQMPTFQGIPRCASAALQDKDRALWT